MSLSAVLRQVRLSGSILSRSAIFTRYEVLPGVRPQSIGGFVAVWDGVSPWGAPPLREFPLQDDDSVSERVLGDLQLRSASYSVGFGVGSDRKSLAALLVFQPGETRGESAVVNLSLEDCGPDYLRIRVQGLPGVVPAERKNWVAVWPGDTAPVNGSGALQRVAIKARESDFLVTLGDCKFLFGRTYTVAYGVSEEWSAMAASLTLRMGSY